MKLSWFIYWILIFQFSAAMLSGRDLETGVMFEKYTIHEISEIEKKIRLLLFDMLFIDLWSQK